MKNRCIEILKKYTGKENIFFTDRGNSSILLALKLAKQLGKKKVFIQDQGGWITYYQYISKLKLEKIILATDFGIISTKELESYLDEESVLLINSMPGYHALQENMAEVAGICKERNSFLINDASGSIGREEAKYGDIILGSFGEWKPIEIGYGGYLAFDDNEYETFFSENLKKELKDFYKELFMKLEELPSRLKKIDKKVKEIKEQLNDFEIIHGNNQGLNVIVRVRSDEEKIRLIDFCKLKGYEFVLCPMYIKVLDNAISIEIMRLKL